MTVLLYTTDNEGVGKRLEGIVKALVPACEKVICGLSRHYPSVCVGLGGRISWAFSWP